MITFRDLIKVLDPKVKLEVCGVAIDPETNKMNELGWFCIYNNRTAESIASELSDQMWFPDEPIWSITKLGDVISIFIVSNREKD